MPGRHLENKTPGQDAEKSRQCSKAALGLWGQIIRGVSSSQAPENTPSTRQSHQQLPLSVWCHATLCSRVCQILVFPISCSVTLDLLASQPVSTSVLMMIVEPTLAHPTSQASKNHSRKDVGCRETSLGLWCETKSFAWGLIALSERWGNNNTNLSGLVRGYKLLCQRQ